MSRAQSYSSDVRRSTGGMAKDVETWLANSLATILAGAGIAGGVIGWFVAMGYVDHANSLTDFDGGMIWMAGGLILAIAANVFRREHHVVDPKEVASTGGYGSETGHRTSGMAKDVETWLANSLATLLAGFAIAGGVIGWFVGMGYVDHSNTLTDFDGAMTWMVGGLIVGIAANVFRREHHLVDPKELTPSTYRTEETYRSEPRGEYRSEPRSR